jgi:hypothetical protein
MRGLTGSTVTLVWLALLLFAVAGYVQAEAILIDFEKYSDGQNLQGVNLGGVTLTNPSGRVEIYDNRFGVSYHSGTKAIASLAGLTSVNSLVGVFDGAVSSLNLWGGDAGTYPETDSWELRAFDAPIGGSLVGQVSSGSWNGSPYRQLSISALEIWRFEADWTGPQFGMGFDDLQYMMVPPSPPPPPPPPPNGDPDSYTDPDDYTDPDSPPIIPEPSAVVLVAVGLLSLLAWGCWRRRVV